MTVAKPESVACDPFKSAKWDELTQGRTFAQSDAPALSLLCQWYKIVAGGRIHPTLVTPCRTKSATFVSGDLPH